ncbi:MAG: hypothetical protein ACT4OK_16695 [Gemmobacter sp.]
MPNQEDDTELTEHETWQREDDPELPPPVPPKARGNLFHAAANPDPQAIFAGTGKVRSTLGDYLSASNQMARGDSDAGAIPAGYTYLAQLLAHDLCAPTRGKLIVKMADILFAKKSAVGASSEMRSSGLMLDSIFGAVTSDDLRAVYPFLRPPGDAAHPAAYDLRRDIGQGPSGEAIEIADVADGRNDDTPMLAQLSALFIRFAGLAAQRHLAQGRGSRLARNLARIETARLFHRILRQDLLPRLLHRDVVAAYGTMAGPLVTGGGLFPVELSNAVLRFGHAMVRPAYRLSAHGVVSSTDLMTGIPGIEHQRKATPGLWRIDWRLFFPGLGGAGVQMARPLRPLLSAGFATHEALPEKHRIPDHQGAFRNEMAVRDIARSVDGGLQRVAVLVEALRPVFEARFPGWSLWNPAAREAMMRSWLPQGVAGHLATDPALYLHVLVEAGAAGPDLGHGQTATLGALGSILLAEVVLQQIGLAEATINNDPDVALAASDGPATMPDLIARLSP